MLPDTLRNNGHPIYEPHNTDTSKLKEAVAPLMKMTIREVLAEVPEASGIFFIGCPNCHSGAQEMNVLGWKPGMGDKVRCNYCGMEFPNAQFPNNREKVIIAPSGVKQMYRYYEDSTGYPYYFEAHAWYERWLWIRPLAEKLAQLWYLTKDNAYGDRAAAIAGRFAQVFPDYAIRFDYPNAPVSFFPANQKWPFDGLSPYRGAKWRWWGYDDIPTYLANVYDLLMSGYDWQRMDEWIGQESEKRIARDLLQLGYEVTTANPEEYSNKSPGLYSEMIRVGRILGEPAMVHEAVKRFREFFPKGFFTDGWWKEGTPSYHEMTINSLKAVARVLDGYSDPPDWNGERLDRSDLTQNIPLFKKAIQVNEEAVLPNGRKIPINDTWGYDWKFGYNRSKKTDTTLSRLWPSLGNAILGTGAGKNQIMVNINWSGNYGHSHFDNGSVILFAMGQELLSDIGYTHSKYRGWTLSTASHNTVVIDQKNQEWGSTQKAVTGNLLFYDDQNSHVKVVDVDASPAYPMANIYRRRLIMVHAASGYDYLIDCFDVKGGKEHDWFLHGMCEQEGVLQTSVPLTSPVENMVPEWGGREVPTKQSDTDPKHFHPYSYIRNVHRGIVNGLWTATWLYDSSGLRSHLLAPPGTEVFRFRAPSIRMADEDDNKLDDYFLNGIMQRCKGGTSTFLAVHEPFRSRPWIDSVKMKGRAVEVYYTLGGKQIKDRLVLNEYGEGVMVTSSAGWQYKTGRQISGEVISLKQENGRWVLTLSKQIPKAQLKYIRLTFSDGSTYYCPVKSVHRNKVEMTNEPGFLYGKETGVNSHTFPGNHYEGPLMFTVFKLK
ncbi:MAG: heparinase II/III family protein [Chitinophagaceae bacterium]|nr:heparinase II/III family protein [Chitinophagaceae bacterium]